MAREPATKASVAVCIVTFNSGDELRGCLESVRAQTHSSLEVIVVDCASDDHSVEEARGFEFGPMPHRILPLVENRGFAGGMNAALEATSAPFALSLNADARPAPDFVQRLLERMEHPGPGHKTGAVTGRLVRARREGEDGAPRLLDACGMRLVRTWRHLDRGSGEEDRGQYAVPERVFGATGAATLYRREALEDCAVEGCVFDPAFHSFREDAELSFRLRGRGWEILYEPAAVAEHRRWNLPERRRQMPAAVNYHSLKNRYLLRFYHQTGSNFLKTLLPTLVRDVLALGYVLLLERTSLRAYAALWKDRRRIRRWRRLIEQRRRVPAAEIDRWFGIEGLPLEESPGLKAQGHRTATDESGSSGQAKGKAPQPPGPGRFADRVQHRPPRPRRGRE